MENYIYNWEVFVMPMSYEKITISLPPDLKRKLEKTAKKERRSQSNLIAWLIERYDP